MTPASRLKRRPSSPGEVLLEDYLRPAGLTQLALAERMDVPIQRVNGIVSGRRAITPETAILLARELGTTPELWMHLQVAVDLFDAEERMGRPAAPRTRRSVVARGARR